MRRTLLALLVAPALLVVAARAFEAGKAAEEVALGERLYRNGIGSGGAAVRATVQEDLVLDSTAMRCVNCHKRSGWGTTEGPVTTPPVVGRVLFRAATLGNDQIGLRSTGVGTRPAYDETSLGRALREGIDPSGRRLSPTMPRYALGPRDLAALAAYLRQLGDPPAPGVTETDLHLATITTPGTDPRKRDAMLSVLRAFVDARNAGTRNEDRRRDHGPWDMKSHYQWYRRWELHEWALEGAPSTWDAQLADRSARQPVFAIVAGMSDGAWEPVHAFCERTHTPCVLPQVPAAPDDRTGQPVYSIYFTRGLPLEAATLARFLGEQVSPPSGPLVQVARCGTPGQAAAAALGKRLGAHVSASSCVAARASLDAAGWRAQLHGAPRALAAWVAPEDLAGLDELARQPGGLGGVDAVYLSGTLAGGSSAGLSPELRSKVYLVTSSVAPDAFEQHARRSLFWLKSRKLGDAEPDVAVNALFAASLVSDAVAAPHAIESQDYFVEQLEHMVGRSPMPSSYPAVSLGPSRRVASLGCAVLKAPTAAGGAFTAVRNWAVPDVDERP